MADRVQAAGRYEHAGPPIGGLEIVVGGVGGFVRLAGQIALPWPTIVPSIRKNYPKAVKNAIRRTDTAPVPPSNNDTFGPAQERSIGGVVKGSDVRSAAGIGAGHDEAADRLRQTRIAAGRKVRIPAVNGANVVSPCRKRRHRETGHAVDERRGAQVLPLRQVLEIHGTRRRPDGSQAGTDLGGEGNGLADGRRIAE